MKHDPNGKYAVDVHNNYVPVSRLESLWTDYLIRQDQPEIGEAAHISKLAADRQVHNIFSPVSQFAESVKNEIRRRLYDNISPYSYEDPYSRLWRGVVMNEPEQPEYGDFAYNPMRDDIWAEYLQIPKEERH